MTASRSDRQGEIRRMVEDALRGRSSLEEGGKEHRFLCPSHADGNHPSAQWNPKKGAWHCKTCGAGGSTEELAVLLGLPVPEARKVSDSRIIRAYDYRDEAGELLYQNVRYEPKDFRVRRPDPDTPGRWLWSMARVRKVLYRLPELVAADKEDWVIYAEGEKDVDRAIAEGVRVATTNAFGANADGKPKWDAGYGAQLAGRRVAILLDEDPAGRHTAQQLRVLLRATASRVVVVRLPGLSGAKGDNDLSDWFDRHEGTADELYRLIEEAAADPDTFDGPGEAQHDAQTVLGFPETDAGNAELYASKWGQLCRYDHQRGRWLVWKGHRWGEDPDGQLYRWAIDTARARQKAVVDADLPDSEFARRMKFARGSETLGKLEAMLKLARNQPPIADPGTGWDSNPFLVGFENGVYNLASGAFRPGRLEDRITMSTGQTFDESARCPRWLQFLEEVFGGSPSMIDYIQRAIGYSITGDTREQVWFLMHGKGANGKSTFLDIVFAALGDYAGNLPFATLQKGKEQSIPTDLAALPGKRFVTSSEATEHSTLNEARIKALTGDTNITARQLYERQFTFKPELKLWIALNHLPKVTDTSDGFWRRVQLIPFTRQFSASERDNGLMDKLKSELPGITRWAVEGARKWMAEGLRPPGAVAVATVEYQTESDKLGEFIRDCCVVGDWAWVGTTQLYLAYRDWAGKRGMRERDVKSDDEFRKSVGERFEKRRRNSGMGYVGLALRSEDDPRDDESVGSEDDFRTQSVGSVGFANQVQNSPPSSRSDFVQKPTLAYTQHSTPHKCVEVHPGTDDEPCEGGVWWTEDDDDAEFVAHCSVCHPMPATTT